MIMSRFLNELAEFLKTQPFEIIRISEVCGDNEPETLEGRPANPCQNVYSVAKSFTMTAIGLLYDRGLVRPEDKVCDILSDELPEEGMDPRWHDVTIDMALTHRLGLPGGFLDIDCLDPLTFGEDYLRFMFLTPLMYDPGTDEAYSDGAFYLLSRIVEKKTGMKTDDFLWKELLFKLKFREMAWSHCPMGHPMGGTGLYIHSADMVKLGQLYMNNGVYKGERLLSEEWTRIAVERHYTFEWNDDETVYFKGGMNGQKIMVAPYQKRAVAMESFGGDSGAVCDFLSAYKD